MITEAHIVSLEHKLLLADMTVEDAAKEYSKNKTALAHDRFTIATAARCKVSHELQAAVEAVITSRTK